MKLFRRLLCRTVTYNTLWCRRHRREEIWGGKCWDNNGVEDCDMAPARVKVCK